jgi:N-acetyl-gamma-glutamyl-phosphate reductase
MGKKKIGIIGATGYTGSELTRLLFSHPEVEIKVITSESRAGDQLSDVHPFFRGIYDHKLVSAEMIEDYDLDLVFMALPHGVSMEFVKKFSNKNFKIIDLSGDFRLDGAETYKTWYHKDHIFPSGFKDAVYGLPELYSDLIGKANLVANPGCYPTCSILGAAPLMGNGLVKKSTVIIDSKSGTTGAGVKAKPVTHFSNVNDNFKAYGLKRHRHTIEIQGILEQLSNNEVVVQFTPHLLPVDRGILSTIYLQPVSEITKDSLHELYQEFYFNAPFVRITDSPPAIKDVRGTNYCNVYTDFDERTGMIIVVSVIDNLVKGAAGQAIQNMNLMFGWDEQLGLNLMPLNP